jgi:hypothetical protein
MSDRGIVLPNRSLQEVVLYPRNFTRLKFLGRETTLNVTFHVKNIFKPSGGSTS